MCALARLDSQVGHLSRRACEQQLVSFGPGYLKMCTRAPGAEPRSRPAPALYPVRGTVVLSLCYIKAAPVASHFCRGSNESPPGPLGISASRPASLFPAPTCLSSFKAPHIFKITPIFYFLFPSSLSVSLKADGAQKQLGSVRVWRTHARTKWIYILDFREARSLVSLTDSHRGALVRR